MEYQDALAVLGVGTAHPGGLDSTMMWIKEIPWTNSMSVLDVGCGTGRSLLEIKRRAGCTVCGVDVRSKMIAKAEKRAAQLGVTAKWLVGDAESLPFGDEAFDVVVTESVNVFLQPGNALQEYYRVLKQGGWYVDVEMLTLAPVPPEWKSSAMQVYGAKLVPDSVGVETPLPGGRICRPTSSRYASCRSGANDGDGLEVPRRGQFGRQSRVCKRRTRSCSVCERGMA